ncbi:8601_t:CDS:1 [Funneliformis geosporum]|uniref:1824_t:CDS:1 n=1 Tax=Funneliformis geosporum TaxID=1117311 RepID=A0A9W4T238_9GLOM|nr:1824_t:CDS:1 [Funneliformis geosporum]CAI2192075.1 8601_t:CDS:1 [Funneliformis geosporum]
MPKTRKQKNNNRVINSYAKFNKVGDDNDNYNYVFKPTFPSSLTINEIISVIKAPSNNKKAKSFPNSFITYKKALIKENRIRNIKLPPMEQLSKVASCYWNKEPENVKEFYRNLSEDAKSLYKQNEIQIVFDKHMNEVEETGQVSHMTSMINKADSIYVNYTQGLEDPIENIIYTQNSTSGYLQIEDDFASVMNSSLGGNSNNSSQESFSNCNFFEYPNRMNEVAYDQEYIRILECENVQLSPLRINTDYVNYTQGIEVPVEDIIFTPNSIDYPTCNIFDQEYGMEHMFNDFVFIENNQGSRQISTCDENSDYVNYEFFP